MRRKAEDVLPAGGREGFPCGKLRGKTRARTKKPPALDTLWADPDAREALLRTVRLLDGREDILGLSTHLLCISEKP